MKGREQTCSRVRQLAYFEEGLSTGGSILISDWWCVDNNHTDCRHFKSNKKRASEQDAQARFVPPPLHPPPPFPSSLTFCLVSSGGLYYLSMQHFNEMHAQAKSTFPSSLFLNFNITNTFFLVVFATRNQVRLEIFIAMRPKQG